jgi:Protein of unknown function (DUF732)
MRFLLTLASLAAIIGVAAPAHADSTDDQFLAALGAAGLTYPDPDKAIAAGKAVCTMAVDQNMNMTNVVIAIHNSNPRLQWDDANKFTSIAANAYCPQVRGGNGENAT